MKILAVLFAAVQIGTYAPQPPSPDGTDTVRTVSLPMAEHAGGNHSGVPLCWNTGAQIQAIYDAICERLDVPTSNYVYAASKTNDSSIVGAPSVSLRNAVMAEGWNPTRKTWANGVFGAASSFLGGEYPAQADIGKNHVTTYPLSVFYNPSLDGYIGSIEGSIPEEIEWNYFRLSSSCGSIDKSIYDNVGAVGRPRIDAILDLLVAAGYKPNTNGWADTRGTCMEDYHFMDMQTFSMFTTLGIQGDYGNIQYSNAHYKGSVDDVLWWLTPYTAAYFVSMMVNQQYIIEPPVFTNQVVSYVVRNAVSTDECLLLLRSYALVPSGGQSRHTVSLVYDQHIGTHTNVYSKGAFEAPRGSYTSMYSPSGDGLLGFYEQDFTYAGKPILDGDWEKFKEDETWEYYRAPCHGGGFIEHGVERVNIQGASLLDFECTEMSCIGNSAREEDWPCVDARSSVSAKILFCGGTSWNFNGVTNHYILTRSGIDTFKSLANEYGRIEVAVTNNPPSCRATVYGFTSPAREGDNYYMFKRVPKDTSMATQFCLSMFTDWPHCEEGEEAAMGNTEFTPSESIDSYINQLERGGTLMRMSARLTTRCEGGAGASFYEERSKPFFCGNVFWNFLKIAQ